MNAIQVRIERCRPGAVVPQYQREGDSGFDFHACIEERRRIFPGSVALIPTGIRMAIPVGYEVQVRSRSGLAVKHHIVIGNAPGTVDASFRGEIHLIVANFSPVLYTVDPGERLAQGVLCPVMQAAWEEGEVGEDETERGAGGFGSTGG